MVPVVRGGCMLTATGYVAPRGHMSHTLVLKLLKLFVFTLIHSLTHFSLTHTLWLLFKTKRLPGTRTTRL